MSGTTRFTCAVLVISAVSVSGCVATPISENPTALTPIPASPATPLSGDRCGIENCARLEIRCGQNVAEVCTMVYMPGDKCRQYAGCRNEGRVCRLVVSQEFDRCRSCVEKCMRKFGNDTTGLFGCGKKC